MFDLGGAAIRIAAIEHPTPAHTRGGGGSEDVAHSMAVHHHRDRPRSSAHDFRGPSASQVGYRPFLRSRRLLAQARRQPWPGIARTGILAEPSPHGHEGHVERIGKLSRNRSIRRSTASSFSWSFAAWWTRNSAANFFQITLSSAKVMLVVPVGPNRGHGDYGCPFMGNLDETSSAFCTRQIASFNCSFEIAGCVGFDPICLRELPACLKIHH